MRSELSPLLGWLLISTISAHVIPGTTVTHESDKKDIDAAKIQELLGKADEAVLHQVLYTISPHQAHQKNHAVVKRQEESTLRNNTIVVSPSTTTIPTTLDALGQSTSTITLPQQSSTIIIIVTNPPSSLSVNAVSPTTISSPAVSTTTIESRTVTSATSGPGATGLGSTSIANSVTSVRTSSSPNGSTRAPNAASSITTGSSQPSAGSSDPEVVLVTSTLADGQVVTQTSYVGAATATEPRESSTSAPAGALQSPSAAHHDHHPLSSGQWLLIAYATCFIFTMAL